MIYILAFNVFMIRAFYDDGKVKRSGFHRYHRDNFAPGQFGTGKFGIKS